MIKVGIAPYLECSSRGNKCFSAFYARIKKRNNSSIEEIYQASKVFEDGSTNLNIAEARGKVAINQEECSLLYSMLWEEYIAENPDLIEILINATGLSDMYGQEGHCCQALELWRIRNNFIEIKSLSDDMLKAAESSMGFWDNEEDETWDESFVPATNWGTK